MFTALFARFLCVPGGAGSSSFNSSMFGRMSLISSNALKACAT